MIETYNENYITEYICFFFTTSLVSAYNATNYNLTSNITLNSSSVENCPLCTYIFGVTLNVSYHNPWSFTLGSLFCSGQAFQTGVYETSYWQQCCRYPLNATETEKDIAHIPLAIIKGLQLENQTQILVENKELNSQVSYLKIALLIVSIIATIFILYYYYTEHWQFRAKP